MAMTKKGSRNILVDEVPYRWKVRGKQTYSQLLAETNLTVAIEVVGDRDISTLLVDTSALRPGNVLEPDLPVSVTPAVVEAYIRLALQCGWKPTEKGKSFTLIADEAMALGPT